MSAVVESLATKDVDGVQFMDDVDFRFTGTNFSLLDEKLSASVASNSSPCDGLRVTFVNRYFYPDMSATSQILFDLARRLVKQGICVNVVCSRQLYNDAQSQLPAEEIIEGIRVYRVATTRFGRDRLSGRAVDYSSFYIAASAKLLQITRAGDVLVAKTDPPLISVAVAAVAKWRGARLVNWLQDLFPEVASHLGKRLPGWLDSNLLRLRDQSLRMASANVVIGTRMKDLLLQRHIDADSIYVVENWADGDYVEPVPTSSSAMRAALGLRGKFVVGYSGNLGRAHEFDTILEAATALRGETDILFLMIGGGIKMQQLKVAVAERGLDNLVFQPYQPRELLADSLAAADVHLTSLLPCLEGLIVPSKFYGILAAGRPSIVIGDVTGELAGIVRREGCGQAVTVGDFDGLISEIWRLKQEPDYRCELGARARSVFLQKYTADRAAQQWLQVLAAVQVESRVSAVGETLARA